MDIVGVIVSLISGAVGGNLSGAALKNMSLGAIGNSIAGAIGGIGGAYIAQAMNLLDSLGLGAMTVGTLLANVGSSAVGGAILTAILGALKKSLSKS
ncbi:MULTISPECIES: hypothetical protein [unclassified Legionella]|uniref:hypothetical protein n=1 Tax=unclassified Legionella TaxID=2622702 RepID=UPI001055F9CA|nr:MULTISPECIES: hypothetical protein [unclassified Legionella]MDI9817571.1 hypothetical protein [Legionella sp. PL877]